MCRVLDNKGRLKTFVRGGATMTEPHLPLDCDHQPVCWKFRYDDKQQEGMLDSCNRHHCIHDTRSRASYNDNTSDKVLDKTNVFDIIVHPNVFTYEVWKLR